MKTNHRKIQQYTVYDKEDKIVMYGTSKEICKRFDITKSNVSKAVKMKRLVRRRYRIYRDDDEE